MSKNLLDELYICDLFQVDQEKGYVDKSELHWNYSIGFMLDDLYDYKLGSVIVKKSNLYKYNLREILTGVPIDTIYENYNKVAHNFSYSHTVKGNKKKYHTFILVDPTNKEVNIDDIYKYCLDHSNNEDYKNYLTELIDKGSKNYNNIRMKEEKKEKFIIQKIKKDKNR